MITNLEGEEWRPVVGFEAYYAVSNMGRVKSLERRMKRWWKFAGETESVLRLSETFVGCGRTSDENLDNPIAARAAGGKRVSVTHGELVEIGRQWLVRQKCTVITTEIATSASEQPDALGWRWSRSVLVECKISVSDFKADAKKVFRVNGFMGLGVERYFLTPRDLIPVSDIPVGWGLLEYDGRRVRTIRKSVDHEANVRNEVLILSSLLRRIGQNAPPGVSIKCYELNTGNRCTLTIDTEPLETPAQTAILDAVFTEIE